MESQTGMIILIQLILIPIMGLLFLGIRRERERQEKIYLQWRRRVIIRDMIAGRRPYRRG